MRGSSRHARGAIEGRIAGHEAKPWSNISAGTMNRVSATAMAIPRARQGPQAAENAILIRENGQRKQQRGQQKMTARPNPKRNQTQRGARAKTGPRKLSPSGSRYGINPEQIDRTMLRRGRGHACEYSVMNRREI